MTKDFHVSFRNDLAKIIDEHKYKYRGFENFGRGIGEEMLQEIERVCKFLDSVKNTPEFHNKVREKYRLSRIKPNVYGDKGLCNCDSLFFEHESDVKGGMAIVGFYLPHMFGGKKQEEELKIFTPNITSKIKNKECIDLYFATYFLPNF